MSASWAFCVSHVRVTFVPGWIWIVVVFVMDCICDGGNSHRKSTALHAMSGPETWIWVVLPLKEALAIKLIFPIHVNGVLQLGGPQASIEPVSPLSEVSDTPVVSLGRGT